MRTNYVTVHARAIDWETDGADVSLPSDVYLTDVEVNTEESKGSGEWEDDVTDAVAKLLTDKYGWLHQGFDLYIMQTR